jgi:mannose-binding lectin 1
LFYLFSFRIFSQFVLELKTRADTIINNQAKQPTAQVQSLGYDTQSLISEMRDGLNHVKQNVAQVAQKIDQSPTGCPSVSCVSVTAVLAIAVVQLLLILGYNIYRDSKENQAKKFY